MVLVDTSVWVSHLRAGDARLKHLLAAGQVTCHPFIIGELACGNVRNRIRVLSLLQALPTARVADNGEVLSFIDRHGLAGAGLGLVDVHLLASACLSHVPLWTADRPLAAACIRLGVAFR